MDDIRFDNVTYQYPDTDEPVFQNLSLALGGGVTTLVGQNGTGKTTLLLLAAGVFHPNAGAVYIQDVDTAQLRDEQLRQQYISLIFQNMEFETTEPVRALLHFVHENGFRPSKNDHLIERLIDAFELKSCLLRRTQELSKGELQRTILAFSLLYGSRIIIMDEPIFALEDQQKQRAMKFLTEFAKQEGISLYYSVHELDISQKYSDYALLFSKDAPPLYGPTANILIKERLEEAYGVPMEFLKQREALHRTGLKGLENIELEKKKKE